MVELKWADVDLKGLTYWIGRTKGRFSRSFPIGRRFLQILFQIDQSTEYVFQRWRHPDSITHLVKDELKKAGFGHLHIHHLRHSYASLYLHKGGDIRALKDLLGHKNIKTTMIYAHLLPNKLAQEANRVDFL